MEPVEHVRHAVDGAELGVVRRFVQRRVLPVPAAWQPPPDLCLHGRHEVLVAAPEEPLEDLGLVDIPTEPAQNRRADAGADALTVDEDAVAVEDHQLQRATLDPADATCRCRH